MRTKLFCFLLILLCLGLQSCAESVKDAVNPYDEHFHCRAKDLEGKCVDTPTAYKEARHPQTAANGSTTIQGLPFKAEAKAGQYKTIAGLLESPKPPLLNPPKILRVLILPYKGEHNELFMTRYAYLEIERASWVLTDIKEK